jgi:hypothetical protein
MTDIPYDNMEVSSRLLADGRVASGLMVMPGSAGKDRR